MSKFSCDCDIVHHEAVEEVKAKMASEELYSKLSDFFRILGDPTRAKIVWALDNKELCVCDISNVLDMTKSSVSHQLSLLRRANLVKFRREGKNVFYSLSDEHIREIFETGIEHISE